MWSIKVPLFFLTIGLIAWTYVEFTGNSSYLLKSLFFLGIMGFYFSLFGLKTRPD